MSLEFQTLAFGVEHLPVAYIAMVARLLRTDVGMILLRNALCKDAQMLGLFAVRVVFYRSAAVVVYHVVLLRHYPLHAEACGHGLVSGLLVYIEMLLDGKIAIGI